jgi:hypothetical protein
MKKTNIILVISLIALLSIVIVLCLVIKHISFDKKETIENNQTEVETVKEEKSSLDTSDKKEDTSVEYNTTIINNNYYYITNYIDNVVEEEISEGNESKLTSTYNVLTDFIFNGGTIKGYTFNELTSEAKEKVMNTYYKLDNYLESKFPNYKSNIKEKAIDIKDTVIEKYNEINTEENRQEIKETYEEVKEKVTPYIEEIKESLKEEKEDATSDYKSIYEIFKNWLNKENETTE